MPYYERLGYELEQILDLGPQVKCNFFPYFGDGGRRLLAKKFLRLPRRVLEPSVVRFVRYERKNSFVGDIGYLVRVKKLNRKRASRLSTGL